MSSRSNVELLGIAQELSPAICACTLLVSIGPYISSYYLFIAIGLIMALMGSIEMCSRMETAKGTRCKPIPRDHQHRCSSSTYPQTRKIASNSLKEFSNRKKVVSRKNFSKSMYENYNRNTRQQQQPV